LFFFLAHDGVDRTATNSSFVCIRKKQAKKIFAKKKGKERGKKKKEKKKV